MNEASGAAPGVPEGVVEEDITVLGRGGIKIPVRTYKPKSPPTSGSPLIVLYHGGGYCLGDLSNEEMNCRDFCKKFGAVCLNVDYRLGPEHKFPAAIDDSYDVLEWVSRNRCSRTLMSKSLIVCIQAAANASSLGANPAKGFLIFGTSAGASISIILSHLARDQKLSPPLTGVGLSIPLAFDVKQPPKEYQSQLLAYEQNKDAPILDMFIMERFLDEYGYDPNSKLFSPFAGPKESWNFSNLPPTAFWICGMDPLRDDGIVYDQVLKENGTKTRLKIYPGVPHSFWSFAPNLEISKKAVGDFVNGIGWLLEQKA